MIVYHGSTEIIKNPDVVHSKKYLDFGRGFYITTFENQAKKWAVRKGMRQEKVAIVNVYELSEAWDDFKVLSFEKENEKWLDFVCACRKGQPLNKEYDIIIGNVRTGCQKKSRRQLYMQLSSRGVDKESIEDALEAYADEQENTVRRLARKRLMQKPPRTEEDFLKAVKSLVSKGFPYEMAKRAVWELRDEYGSTNK